ncbi:DUF2381 family protein [Melittangium boletus]|uniref:DUF2381 family protein n=1 Tax=Melittangium boletus DSM 14713 TaxID=1294270 RepID=A0A250ITB6_9BACT|nr:DUF2381 family protein [Melittangium boletus]ATB34391.1 hypothetical protein MEBOL_007893 [Melittangium boletus DSM 14713]
MSASSVVASLALVLFVGTSARAQPSLPECEVSPPPIELPEVPPSQGWEVCISPGVSTTLRFDAPLPPGAVVLRGRERFVDVLMGTHSFMVLPSAALQPGERFEVEVRFGDGSAPTNATFWLVVHPAVATHQVNVLRHPRTVEDYQRENQAEREKSQRLAREMERMRAEHGPGGLTGLIANGWVTVLGKGVQAKSIGESVTRASTNALKVYQVDSYRSNLVDVTKARVAVAVELKNRGGGQPWVVKGAALMVLGGEARSVSTFWQSEPLDSDAEKAGWVVVELELPVAELQGPRTLKLWDESGGRLVTLGNVTFP